MKKLLIVALVFCICFGYACTHDEASKKTYKTFKEGIFQVSMPSHFTKVTGRKLKEFRSQYMNGGQELAEASKSADPKVLDKISLSFFSAYDTSQGKVSIFFAGIQTPVVMNRDEMYKTNAERIEWGINSGRLSKNSKGVTKLTIDHVPSLFMDIETIGGGRLLTYLFFVSENPKYSFQIGIVCNKGHYGKNEGIIKSIVNSVKIMYPK